MKIKVEKSGGFAGISYSNEIDAEKLPSSLLSTLRGLTANTKSPTLSLKSSPIGAADHYTYKITIRNGRKQRVIECNQYNLNEDLRSIIRYVETKSKKV